MNSKLRSILIISAKNAVNAILTNAALMATMGQWFHLHSRSGLYHVLDATLCTVIGREALVWIPKLLAWSQSDTNGQAKAAGA